MKRTPFFDYSEREGGKFVDFAGWEMPIHFGSIIDEHVQVREAGGLFDVSHMARINMKGVGARKFLERLLTRRVSDMKPNTCRYALVCNAEGGVRDDVLIYKYPEHWMLVVNASNREKIAAHMEQVKADEGHDLAFDDVTESTAMIAIQGPIVMDMISQFSSEIVGLKRYTFCEKQLLNLEMTISRTGYTGEDGVEVILNASMAEKAIEMMLKAGGDAGSAIKCSGLGARDSLRLEAGMPLYGHELEEDIDPLTAGLNFAVSLDKDEDEDGISFIGQDKLKAIKNKGLTRKLVGIKLEGKRTARQGMDVCFGGAVVGQVSSGCVSPTLGYPIAMAIVGIGAAEVGGAVEIKKGDRVIAMGEVVKLPFYKKPKK